MTFVVEEINRQRLRDDLGLSTSVETPMIDDCFARADELYDGNTAAIEAQARCFMIRMIIAQASKRPDYVANEKNISMKQIVDNLYGLLKLYEEDVEKIAGTGAARVSGLYKRPRNKELPLGRFRRIW